MPSPTTPLSPKLLEKARLELNEIQSQVPDQIKSLRSKILEDKNLNFRSSGTLDIQNALSSNLQGALFTRDSEGRAIIVFNSLSHWNPSKFSLADLIANMALTLECLVEEEDVQINGIVIIINTKDLGWNHLVHINPLTLERCVQALLNSFPVRYKNIHFFNEPFIFNAVFRMLKPFLRKKILSRIRFHGGCLETLHDFVSPEILPEEFGGHLGPCDNSSWNRILEEHDQTLIRNYKFGFLKNS